MPDPVLFRTATQEDALAFYGRPPDYSFRGVVAVLDGRVVGIGGVYRDAGRPIVFTDMKDEMREHRRARAKAVRIMIELADRHPIVYAVASPDEPTSGPLLAKLGFEPTGEMTPYGELLARRAG